MLQYGPIPAGCSCSSLPCSTSASPEGKSCSLWSTGILQTVKVSMFCSQIEVAWSPASIWVFLKEVNAKKLLKLGGLSGLSKLILTEDGKDCIGFGQFGSWLVYILIPVFVLSYWTFPLCQKLFV